MRGWSADHRCRHGELFVDALQVHIVVAERGDSELVDKHVEVVVGIAALGGFHRSPFIPRKHFDLAGNAGEVSHGVGAYLARPPIFGAENTEFSWVLSAGSNELPGLASGEELSRTNIAGMGWRWCRSVEVLGVDPDPALIRVRPYVAQRGQRRKHRVEGPQGPALRDTNRPGQVQAGGPARPDGLSTPSADQERRSR